MIYYYDNEILKLINMEYGKIDIYDVNGKLIDTKEIRNQINDKLISLSALKNQYYTEKANYKTERLRLKDVKQALIIAQQVAQTIQQKAHEQIAGVVTKCLQAVVRGVEADDIIYTYCLYAKKWNGKAVVVSSDTDFYQVLGMGPEITLFDAMKDSTWTEERFMTEFGFSPKLWVDVGALMGDKTDNIFGVDGWGPKTACDNVRAYGDWRSVVAAVRGKPKKNKKEQKLLDSLDIVGLAYSLKKMDEIGNIPRPKCESRDGKLLYGKFLELGFMSLLRDIPLVV
jgi:hypothetical protein